MFVTFLYSLWVCFFRFRRILSNRNLCVSPQCNSIQIYNSFVCVCFVVMCVRASDATKKKWIYEISEIRFFFSLRSTMVLLLLASLSSSALVSYTSIREWVVRISVTFGKRNVWNGRTVDGHQLNGKFTQHWSWNTFRSKDSRIVRWPSEKQRSKYKINRHWDWHVSDSIIVNDQILKAFCKHTTHTLTSITVRYTDQTI